MQQSSRCLKDILFVIFQKQPQFSATSCGFFIYPAIFLLGRWVVAGEFESRQKPVAGTNSPARINGAVGSAAHGGRHGVHRQRAASGRHGMGSGCGGTGGAGRLGNRHSGPSSSVEANAFQVVATGALPKRLGGSHLASWGRIPGWKRTGGGWTPPPTPWEIGFSQIGSLERREKGGGSSNPALPSSSAIPHTELADRLVSADAPQAATDSSHRIRHIAQVQGTSAQARGEVLAERNAPREKRDRIVT